MTGPTPSAEATGVTRDEVRRALAKTSARWSFNQELADAVMPLLARERELAEARVEALLPEFFKDGWERHLFMRKLRAALADGGDEQ